MSNGDDSVEQVWKEFGMETDALHQMATNHQRSYEETIGNLAALKMLSDGSIEESVKNS